MALGDIRIVTSPNCPDFYLEDLGGLWVGANMDILITEMFDLDLIINSKSLAEALDSPNGGVSRDFIIKDYTKSETNPRIIDSSAKLRSLGYGFDIGTGLGIGPDGELKTLGNLETLYGLTGYSNAVLYFDGTETLNATPLGTFGQSLLGAGTDVDARNLLNVYSKNEIDSFLNGLRWKAPVRVATTGPGNLATDFAAGSVVDGVTLAAGDRILIKDQADPTENGIYEVQASGAPVRTADADSDAELLAAAVFVLEGTANADKAFVQTVDSNILTTGPSFVVFSSAGASLYTASEGIQLTGNDFRLDINGLVQETSADYLDFLGIYQTLTGTHKKITVGDLINSIDINDIPGVLSADKGGTGLTGAGIGDLLVGQGPLGYVTLPIGTLAGQVLTVDGSGMPVWSNPPATYSFWTTSSGFTTMDKFMEGPAGAPSNIAPWIAPETVYIDKLAVYYNGSTLQPGESFSVEVYVNDAPTGILATFDSNTVSRSIVVTNTIKTAYAPGTKVSVRIVSVTNPPAGGFDRISAVVTLTNYDLQPHGGGDGNFAS